MKNETLYDIEVLKREIQDSISKTMKLYKQMKEIIKKDIEDYDDYIKEKHEKRLLFDQMSFTRRMKLPSDKRSLLCTEVRHLKLSSRVQSCLDSYRIKYIYELVSKTEGEMLRSRNFGRTSLTEIKTILSLIGLRFGMKHSPEMKDYFENNKSNLRINRK